MEPDLTFRVVLEKPPPGFVYGVQIGRGAALDTAEKQRSTGKDLRFEFAVAIRGKKPTALDFRGPVVQGPPGGRFVYIGIGTYAGETTSSWSGRLKIPLAGLTWDVIERAFATRMILETQVPGTGRDGRPTCATVKPFGGWKLAT